jgi:hypothetical protein
MSVNDAPRIIIDNSRVMLQMVASLTDESRGITYDHNVSKVSTDLESLEFLQIF